MSFVEMRTAIVAVLVNTKKIGIVLLVRGLQLTKIPKIIPEIAAKPESMTKAEL